MAQGQVADGGEECPAADCLRRGRHQLLRNAVRVRGHKRRQELGGDCGLLAHPDARGVPQRPGAAEQGRVSADGRTCRGPQSHRVDCFT